MSWSSAVSRDAIQDVLVHQRCIGKIGFVLYKCQQHQLNEVINAVLHDDADPAACVLTIEDGHSLLSPFEHLASFSLQYRSIAHLINKTAVLKDTISMKYHFSEVVAYLAFFSGLLILRKLSVLDGALRIALKSG